MIIANHEETLPLSHGFEKAARKIILKRSKYLIILISVLAGSTFLCLWLSAAAFIFKLLFSLAPLGFSLLFIYQMGHNSITALWCLTQFSPANGRGEGFGSWGLQNRRGEISWAILRGDSYISRFLLILNFKIEGKRGNHVLVLLPDALDKSAFRQLRAFLLLQ